MIKAQNQIASKYTLAFLLLSGCMGSDKILHAGIGAGVGVIADDASGMGCEAALAIGVIKELIDPVFSLPDVLATSIYCLGELL